MKWKQAIDTIVAKIPADVRGELSRVRIDVKPSPEAIDIDRGCDKGQVAYFFGTRPGDDDGSGGNMLPDSNGPEGSIVVFSDNLAPVTLGKLEGVIMHELAHALGYDEEEIISVMGYDPCR